MFSFLYDLINGEGEIEKYQHALQSFLKNEPLSLYHKKVLCELERNYKVNVYNIYRIYEKASEEISQEFLERSKSNKERIVFKQFFGF